MKRLEMAIDPEVNLYATGPHPEDPSRQILHWYELCDAVQAETYEIDGVEVSNFVLPLYFTGRDEHHNHNDFLGNSLPSFGVAPGGYIGYLDPATGETKFYVPSRDGLSGERKAKRDRFSASHWSTRHQRDNVGDSDAALGQIHCVCISFEVEHSSDENVEVAQSLASTPDPKRPYPKQPRSRPSSTQVGLES